MVTNPIQYPWQLLFAASITLLARCSDLTTTELLDANFLSETLDRSVPELIQPADEETITNISNRTVTFEWDANIGAISYTLEIVADDGTEDPFQADANNIVPGNPFNTGTMTSIDLNLPGAYSYRWRVASNLSTTIPSARRLHTFEDAILVYCPASITDCKDDEDDDGKLETIGNLTAPFRKINNAVTGKTKIGLSQIRVANRDSDNTAYKQPFLLSGAVSINGGYDNTDWSQTNTKTAVSADTAQTIRIKGADAGVSLHNLTLSNSSSLAETSVINISGKSSLVLQDSILRASNSTDVSGQSHGLLIRDASVTVTRSTIYAGKSGDESYGIRNNAGIMVIIEDSHIIGGEAASFSYGIHNNGSSPLIENSLINGGHAQSNNSFGIYNTVSAPIIINCRVAGGVGSSASYGIGDVTANSVTISNSLFGGTADSSIAIWTSANFFAVGNLTIGFRGNAARGISGGGEVAFNTSLALGAGEDNGIAHSTPLNRAAGNFFMVAGTGNDRVASLELSSADDPPILVHNAMFDAGSGGNFSFYADFVGVGSGNCPGDTLRDCYTIIGDVNIPANTTQGVAGSSESNITDSGGGNADFFSLYPDDIVATYISTDGDDTEYSGDTDTIEVEVDSGSSIDDCAKFVVGEYFEYFYDGIAREITGTDCTTTMTVEFTPALDIDYGPGVPIFLWGSQSLNYDRKYALTTGTTALNAGLDCPADYSVVTHVWGAATSQSDCDLLFPHADATFNGGNCETNHLSPALEIMGDDVGNDNGLCEAGEDCLHNPNIGYYAGHGSLVDSACDVSGLLDASLKEYSQNGY